MKSANVAIFVTVLFSLVIPARGATFCVEANLENTNGVALEIFPYEDVPYQLDAPIPKSHDDIMKSAEVPHCISGEGVKSARISAHLSVSTKIGCRSTIVKTPGTTLLQTMKFCRGNALCCTWSAK